MCSVKSGLDSGLGSGDDLAQDVAVAEVGVQFVAGLQSIGETQPLVTITGKEDVTLTHIVAAFLQVGDSVIQQFKYSGIDALLAVQLGLQIIDTLQGLAVRHIAMQVSEDTQVQGSEGLGYTQQVRLIMVDTVSGTLVNDFFQTSEGTVGSVPLVVKTTGGHILADVAKLGPHQLVITRTELLLGERGDIPCIVARDGVVSRIHNRSGDDKLAIHCLGGWVSFVHVNAVHQVFTTRSEQDSH